MERSKYGFHYNRDVVGVDFVQLGKKQILEVVGGFVHNQAGVYGLRERKG